MEPTLRDKIIILLKKYDKLRDNPDKLIIAIWMNEIKEEHRLLTVVDFMTLAYKGNIKLTSPSTINRTRREIQKEFKELAGNRVERLAKADHIRKHIKSSTFITIPDKHG